MKYGILEELAVRTVHYEQMWAVLRARAASSTVSEDETIKFEYCSFVSLDWRISKCK